LNVAVARNNFIYHYPIGKGGFGKVWRVERKKDRQLYAMKEMSKARVLTKRSVNSVINERKILTQLKSE
jgi:serine/threonine protein kinase